MLTDSMAAPGELIVFSLSEATMLHRLGRTEQAQAIVDGLVTLDLDDEDLEIDLYWYRKRVEYRTDP